jgi:hypothetical protein
MQFDFGRFGADRFFAKDGLQAGFGALAVSLKKADSS